jgi:hypothetical protein
MDRQKLIELIEGCKNHISEFEAGKCKIFHLNTECVKGFTTEPRIKLIEQLGENKLQAIISRMHEDDNFRNFMLVNLDYIHNKILVELKNFEKINGPKNDFNIHEFTFWGVGTPYEEDWKLLDSFLTTESVDYFRILKRYIGCDISSLRFGGREKYIDAKEAMVKPAKQLFKIIGVQDLIREGDGAVFVESPFDNTLTRSLFSLWQLNVFFEHYVAELIRRNITKKLVINPHICIAPYEKNAKMYGCFETDILAYNEKADKIIAIECKNGSIIETEVSKFIGRMKLFEQTQGITLNKKAIIATKYEHAFFRAMPPEKELVGVRLFDNKDFRARYKNFVRYCN